MPSIIAVIAIIVALVLGILAGYIVRKSVGEREIGSAETKAKNIILDAEAKSETIQKEIALKAQEEAISYKKEAEKEIKDRRNEVSKAERRVNQKEETIDKKLDQIERKEQSITVKEQNINNKLKNLDQLHEKQVKELERISGYTTDEAKKILLTQ